MTETSNRTRSARSARILLALVWLAGAAWGWAWLDRGWVPHDEGALGQSAERVLAGEIPHVDYDEIYTGALTYGHALAFEAFGVRLISMRYVLFAAFLAWIPAVWVVARHFAPPWLAALATLCAVVLSVPNYSASLPSWYQLFVTTVAVAAMARHVRSGTRAWLVVAGAAAGVSILMKIVGFFLLGALLLWLVYEEQEESRAGGGAGGRIGSVVLSLGLFALTTGLAVLVSGYGGASQVVQFVIPGAVLAAYLGVREWSRPREPALARGRRLGSRVGALAAGAAAPLFAFGLLYADAERLRSLYEGVFVLPRSRLEFATMRPPRLETVKWVAVPILLVVGAARASGKERRRITALAGVLLAVVLALSGDPAVYRSVWYAIRWSIPALALAGVVALSRGTRETGGRENAPEVAPRSLAFGLLAVVSLVGLVQFPFSAPIYFLYVAPLVLLAFLAVGEAGGAPRPVVASLVVFLLLFVSIRVTPGFIYVMGLAPGENLQTEPLSLERGGVLVTEEDRRIYEGLVGEIRARVDGGAVWAGPDAPEVYFLSGADNPTRRVFDFLDRDDRDPGSFVETLARAGVDVVVVNAAPSFSEPLDPEVVAAIEERWPARATFGRFEVHWAP